jgi:acyl-homoserine-lactone acylase
VAILTGKYYIAPHLLHMKSLITCFIFCALPYCLIAQPSKKEIDRWNKTASRVSIIRDQWGIPHVYGKTDADAVFGLMYAQCEDDFNRIELNYIEKLGRKAMIEGEKEIYNDLYIRLVISEDDAKADYAKAPAWLRSLLNAFADGVNFYLYKNPGVKPRLLSRFEPWYPLLWTDGSIGAISTGYLNAGDLKNFYSKSPDVGTLEQKSTPFENLDGSNGFAVAGFKSKSGNAMLYINPHVTLYFRPEVHMVSEEGLNAYGAVTWGQFFVYQGFNEYNGWMHTSSDADVSDMYLEKISSEDNQYVYEYEGSQKPVTKKEHVVSFKSGEEIKQKSITTYATHHGPVMAKREDRWVSVRSNNRSMDGLIQSWQRTKTKGFEDYKKVMDIRANTSNNTVYADNKGNIAYWHGNFMPKRNPNLYWGKAVDGTLANTEWGALHSVEETVHIYNPENGWLQNCNSTPFTAAGKNSPQRSAYPTYMAPDGENYRGVNAVRVLSKYEKFSLNDLITAGYDRSLAAFDELVPALVKAYVNQSSDTSLRTASEAIQLLKEWDFKCSEQSVPATLAVQWGQQLTPKMTVSGDEDEYGYVDQVERTRRYLSKVTDQELTSTFIAALSDLKTRYGTWKLPYGEINRFQRISNSIDNVFSDDKASFPIGFGSSAWGSLPSYATRSVPNAKKKYVTGGNSFICAVEFGKRVVAKSLLAGGESGDPKSKHFFDQGEMFAKGVFKDVMFYKEDVLKGAERTYHPGE